MYKVVFIRHGESIWNKKDIFTGWTDIGLSRKGKKEAKKARELLKDYSFDVAFCSVLKRAIQTLEIILKKNNIPFYKSKALNERHYGALQGKSKSKTKEKYGQEKFFQWRRSYKIKPPALETGEVKTESLEDTFLRVIPYWENTIKVEVKKGKKVLVVSHGSVMRALLKYFNNISDEDIENVNVPTGFPLIFEFDNSMMPMKHYYLGDEKEVAKATSGVRDQGVH